MTTKVILADEIGSKIHDILAGEHFLFGLYPHLYILSPWISNVEIRGKIPKMGAVSPQICYTFESMDLAHAILLARLLFDIEVKIITKSPTEETYSYPVYVKNLLDFLDEIGCSVFTNDTLHSKMLLTGIVAIVGSMNLTKSALYNREEIAVSIDDMENLGTLYEYADDVVKESEPYGFTAYGGERDKVTRGWLYTKLGGTAHKVFRKHDLSIENILSNIETFYLESIIKLSMEKNLESYSRKVWPFLRAYKGPYASEDGAMVFLKEVLAREQFPEIKFTYKNVNVNWEQFMKEWELTHGKKKTRQRQV